MDTFIILQQMFVIAVLVVIGYALYRRQVIGQIFLKQLSVVITYITNPALIIATVINGTIETDHKLLLQALVIAAVLYLVLCVLGFLIPKVISAPGQDQRFYNMMTVYTNTGFIGIPLASAILPASAMIYVIVFNVMFSIFIYTHGVCVLGGREKISLARIFSPGTISAVIAILIYWFDFHVPMVPGNIVTYLGSATTFLTMTMLGASIAQQSIRAALKDRHVWRFTIVRMLIVPAALTIVLKAIHTNPDMIVAYCLMMALPAANMPLILAEKEDLPTDILARGILITTICSFVTITFLLGVLF